MRNLELRVNAEGVQDVIIIHAIVNESQEVIINSMKHSHSTCSQVSAKEEAGMAHTTTLTENLWGPSYLCSSSSESAQSTLPYLNIHNRRRGGGGGGESVV